MKLDGKDNVTLDWPETPTVETRTTPDAKRVKTSKTMMTGWGDIPERILQVLHDYGPMTGQDMEELLDIPVGIVNKTLRRMRQPSLREKPLGERRVHIVDRAPEAEGQRPYPRPIYAAGHGEHKKRPPKKRRNAVVRDYYRSKKAKTRMNFVFNLGGRA